MRIKTFIAIAVVSLSGALATTEASASQLTPTEVTIQAESGGDFFGYVHSSDDNCESGRKVTLFRMLGSSPDRSVDQKIGSDTAEPNGPDSMWSTGNTGQRHGYFYAKVGKTSTCQGDTSPVVKAQK